MNRVSPVKIYNGFKVDYAAGTIQRYIKRRKSWVLVGSLNTGGYKQFATNRKIVYNHRFIVEAFLGRPLRQDEIVNHLNHKVTDNRLANLQVTTKQGNSQYRVANKGSTSQFTGVSFHKASKKWRADIKCNGVPKNLGYFTNEVDAAKAYNKQAEELNQQGHNYRLNQIPAEEI